MKLSDHLMVKWICNYRFKFFNIYLYYLTIVCIFIAIVNFGSALKPLLFLATVSKTLCNHHMQQFHFAPASIAILHKENLSSILKYLIVSPVNSKALYKAPSTKNSNNSSIKSFQLHIVMVFL